MTENPTTSHDLETDEARLGSVEAKSRNRPAATSMFDPAIMRRAFGDSLRKLDPRLMVRNPVMFVVEIGSVLTTVLFFTELSSSSHNENVFAGTRRGVALVHRAVRQLRRGGGRGAGQGPGRHAARGPPGHRRARALPPTARWKTSRAPRLQVGDVVIVVGG